MRSKGYHILHTREGHRPEPVGPAGQQTLALAAHRRRHRRPRPVRQDSGARRTGWEIIPELAPFPGETIIDKPGKGTFCATDLELILRTRGIENIILTGITTESACTQPCAKPMIAASNA